MIVVEGICCVLWVFGGSESCSGGGSCSGKYLLQLFVMFVGVWWCWVIGEWGIFYVLDFDFFWVFTLFGLWLCFCFYLIFPILVFVGRWQWVWVYRIWWCCGGSIWWLLGCFTKRVRETETKRERKFREGD